MMDANASSNGASIDFTEFIRIPGSGNRGLLCVLAKADCDDIGIGAVRTRTIETMWRFLAGPGIEVTMVASKSKAHL